jgi:hypothetical protein
MYSFFGGARSCDKPADCASAAFDVTSTSLAPQPAQHTASPVPRHDASAQQPELLQKARPAASMHDIVAAHNAGLTSSGTQARHQLLTMRSYVPSLGTAHLATIVPRSPITEILPHPPALLAALQTPPPLSTRCARSIVSSTRTPACVTPRCTCLSHAQRDAHADSRRRCCTPPRRPATSCRFPPVTHSAPATTPNLQTLALINM